MKVYLSSTFEDLEAHRAAVARAVRRFGYDLVAMEDYVAAGRRPLDQVRADVVDSDVCLCIVGWRYGYVPPPNHGGEPGRSITELEYRAAQAAGQPVLAFLADPGAAWPPTAMDSHTGENDAGARVRTFREELATEHMVSFFSTPDQLAGLAGPALYKLEGELGNRAEVATAPTPPVAPQGTDLPKVIDEIQRHLRDTRQAFLVQAEQRDALRNNMERRLQPDDDPPLEYELFFAKYYDQLSEEDRFQFDRVRALTEGPMHDGNQRVLELLNAYPQVRREIPDLNRLRQHLAFWINKYDHLFVRSPNMCVLYVGVEDRTPFPAGVEERIAQWQLRSAAK